MIDIKELRSMVNAAHFESFANSVINSLLDRIESTEKERDELRDRIEEMEQQKPVGWLLDGEFYEVRQTSLYKDNEPLPGQTALYLTPGAKGE